MDGMGMGECENRQRKSCNTETNYKHSKGGYGRLPLNDVCTWHEFCKEHTSLEKSTPRHFFTSLLSHLSTKDLVTLGNLLLIEFLKAQK
jgi:hypothetical protein